MNGSELDRRVVAVAVGLSPPICLESDDFDAHASGVGRFWVWLYIKPAPPIQICGSL
jgi:hypothetical protein